MEGGGVRGGGEGRGSRREVGVYEQEGGGSLGGGERRWREVM